MICQDCQFCISKIQDGEQIDHCMLFSDRPYAVTECDAFGVALEEWDRDELDE